MRSTPLTLTAALLLGLAIAAPIVAQRPLAAAGPANPYNLEPFHAGWPLPLEYPNHHGLDYDRTRRQIYARIVANLQGAGRRETWQTATEFFWDGPEEAIEPLIEAMDRHFGDPSMQDMVRNCVEAMGRMGSPEFDDALQRALEHKNRAVRQSALGALARSSRPQTLRDLHGLWSQMDARSRQAWLHGARVRLGKDAVPLFQELMMAEYPPAVRDQILLETMKMPIEDAAVVLRGRWGEAISEFKAIIAGVLHAVGDTAGTTWMRDTLEGADLAMLPLAVKHCIYGPPGPLRDSLLKLSSHPRAEIRFELAKALTRFDGDDIADVYELLSQPDEAWETKSLALRELTRRGRTGPASVLLEEVATARGTRLQLVLNMLGATADARAVPIFVERFQQAPPGEGRPFLQSLAVLGNEAAARAMLELFAGPERLVDRAGASGQLTTLGYIPLLLMNARGSEAVIITAFQKLPKDDWMRRALLLPTVIGMAADSGDDAVEAMALPVVKAILFDRDETPQLRVQALNLLTRSYLEVDDVLRLKNMRHDEQPGMRALLADFLLDFF